MFSQVNQTIAVLCLDNKEVLLSFLLFLHHCNLNSCSLDGAVYCWSVLSEYISSTLQVWRDERGHLVTVIFVF